MQKPAEAIKPPAFPAPNRIFGQCGGNTSQPKFPANTPPPSGGANPFGNYSTFLASGKPPSAKKEDSEDSDNSEGNADPEKDLLNPEINSDSIIPTVEAEKSLYNIMFSVLLYNILG